MAGGRKYIKNSLWLIVPPILILAIVSPLPLAYRTAVFWKDIPGWVSLGESLTRTILVVWPAFMPFRIASRTQRTGLTLYILGLAAYWAAWQVPGWLLPSSAWSTSALAFMAPAWTPAIWLVDIALMNEQMYFWVRYRRWMYLAVACVFLSFHNYHAWVVWT